MEVGAWVYKHFNEIGGVSFLPYSDHSYKQAPYQPCSKEVYDAAVASFPAIDWDAFKENEDTLTSYKELACVSGVCEI
jgi:ribonucleoside-diphosphate reductase alpha chain